MKGLFIRLFPALLVLTLLLSACGGSGTAEMAAGNTSTWQEQYDLGIKFLSEGNYEDAIIAFTAAIEIDPKQVDAYISLAEIYSAQGNPEKAAEILNQALEAVGENEAIMDAQDHLKGIRTERNIDDDQQQTFKYHPDGTVDITVSEAMNDAWGPSYYKDGPITGSCTYTMAEPNHTIYAWGYSSLINDDLVISRFHVFEYDSNYRRVAEANIATEQSSWPGIVKCTYSDTQATLYVRCDNYDFDGNLIFSDSKTVSHTMQSPENSLSASHCPRKTNMGILEIVVIERDPIGNVVYENSIEY